MEIWITEVLLYVYIMVVPTKPKGLNLKIEFVCLAMYFHSFDVLLVASVFGWKVRRCTHHICSTLIT